MWLYCDYTVLSCRAFWMTTVWSGWETGRAVTQLKVSSHRTRRKASGSQVLSICLFFYRLQAKNIYLKWFLRHWVYLPPQTPLWSGTSAWTLTSCCRGSGSWMSSRGRESVLCSPQPRGRSWRRRNPFNWVSTATGSSCSTVLSARIRSKAPRLALQNCWGANVVLWSGFFGGSNPLLILSTAVHARSDGRVFSIWASGKISRWCAFRGLCLVSVREQMRKCALLLIVLFWRRFMTGEMRNLSSGYRGISFLEKERLFVGRKMNQVCPANITPTLPDAEVGNPQPSLSL